MWIEAREIKAVLQAPHHDSTRAESRPGPGVASELGCTGERKWVARVTEAEV